MRNLCVLLTSLALGCGGTEDPPDGGTIPRTCPNIAMSANVTSGLVSVQFDPDTYISSWMWIKVPEGTKGCPKPLRSQLIKQVILQASDPVAGLIPDGTIRSYLLPAIPEKQSYCWRSSTGVVGCKHEPTADNTVLQPGHYAFIAHVFGIPEAREVGRVYFEIPNP